jgi:hypothetical protein
MLLVHPNIKVIYKLVRPQGGSVMPECQPLLKAFQWLTLPGILCFDHFFRVAHFDRNGGSLCSGMVAQYGPDYSVSGKWNLCSEFTDYIHSSAAFYELAAPNPFIAIIDYREYWY